MSRNTYFYFHHTRQYRTLQQELNNVNFVQNHLTLKSMQYLEVEDKSPYRYGVWRHLSQSQLSNWPAKSIMRQLISELAKSINWSAD